ncbi:hypothetical protein GCM10009828_084450 [Actinoplanes couchii]|uniref:Uncharacterized protein n=1 Tax=Actinoplanes couchii TaxID=403638 RepID=A0ABQ3XNN4_9ACTN|nr:hypothetical protein Aco03nite_084980 [Actinoplanes couchii]
MVHKGSPASAGEGARVAEAAARTSVMDTPRNRDERVFTRAGGLPNKSRASHYPAIDQLNLWRQPVRRRHLMV